MTQLSTDLHLKLSLEEEFKKIDRELSKIKQAWIMPLPVENI